MEEPTARGAQVQWRAAFAQPCLLRLGGPSVLNRGATDRIVCPGGKLLEGAYVVTAMGDSALFRLTRQHQWAKGRACPGDIRHTSLACYPQRGSTARFRSPPHRSPPTFHSAREARGRSHVRAEHMDTHDVRTASLSGMKALRRPAHHVARCGVVAHSSSV